MFRRWLALLLVAALAATPAQAVFAEDVELIGTLSIPGDDVDLSQKVDLLDGRIPHNQFGGISAIAYTGKGNRYLLLPDRGPSDGAVPYLCRFHEAEIDVDPKKQSPFSFQLVATQMLTNEQNQPFSGSSAAFDSKFPARSLRLDPEGVRTGTDGSVFLADEYGPHLLQFSAEGLLLKRFPVPPHVSIKHLGTSKEIEHQANKTGRQTNRGFEGLAIDAEAGRLYAVLQGPLLQDQPFDDAGERLGIHVRIIEYEIETGSTREFVYALEKPSYGISEILLSGPGRFLVLERDGQPGAKAKCKRLYEIDLAEATDVSRMTTLPADKLPAGVRAVSKRVALDLLDARFGLAGDQFPEKLEGLAFGPDLPDGRRLLLVASDNDFEAANPTWIYAFGIHAPDGL
jgi:hypothetical protein